MKHVPVLPLVRGILENRTFRTIALGVGALPVVALGALAAIGAAAPIPGKAKTPAGYAQNEARYLTMRDGVKLAVDIWFPADLQPGERVPTLIRSTRYGRAYHIPFGKKVMIGLSHLGLKNRIETVKLSVKRFNEARYAIILVDVRGSGASFGTRPVEWSADEVADFGEIVEWVVAQPWSNGNVGGWGISYDGNTAELLTVPNKPAVKAVAPMYDDFDPHLHLAMPGGVFNRWFIEHWNASNQASDSQDIGGLFSVSGVAAMRFKFLETSGIKPVDGDCGRRQLKAAIASHTSLNVFDALQKAACRDDTIGESGLTIGALSPQGLRQAIESSRIPMYVWASWLDSATIEGALGRYLTFSNPQKLIIGPWSHGGIDQVDPFFPEQTAPIPSLEDQMRMLIDFFDGYLKGVPSETHERSITYYTLGENAWKTTTCWPPSGFVRQRWYLHPQGRLVADAPTDATGSDAYTVDFTATTGEPTRWHTSLGGPVAYRDRAEEDKKLLTYTSDPMQRDMEITGSPIITLYFESTETDGALHVYLEDVAPNGRVTYITEGILRVVHRNISSDEPPYHHLGPYHSFKRSDMMPLVPGTTTEISFQLFATSVLIKTGHRVRIAIAGHDASVFARYPAVGTPVLTIQRNNRYPSHIDLPLMERS